MTDSNSLRPTLAIIGFIWPEPDSSAAGQNMMGIIDTFLARHWQVFYLTAASAGENQPDLNFPGLTTESIALNCSSFDNRIREINPDVVIFDRFMTEEQFGSRVYNQCPDAVRILNTEDLHSLRAWRQTQAKHAHNTALPEEAVCDDITFREIASVHRSDLTLVISPQEYQLLTQVYQVPADQLLLLPLLMSPPAFEARTFSQRADFVFIGNFRHAPNWDAVLKLQGLWPLIRKQLPQAELNIYGAYPPKKAMVLDNPKTGFRVRGWATHAAQTVANHRIMLAPLRFGAGVKGKLVMAAQCNTPSITTTIGAEGIAERGHWPGYVTDDDMTFVQQAVSLYCQEDEWQKVIKQGQKEILEQFDYARNQARLHENVQLLRENYTNYRRNRFLQGMLWHHSLRATQFMSQWIEAKNRLV